MSFLRKYNVTLSGATSICVQHLKSGSEDFATGSDWTPVAGDVQISKDGGAFANIGTLPAYTNGQWQYVLTGTELTAKQVQVRIVDSPTKVVQDDGFIIETFGHASAMIPSDYTVDAFGAVMPTTAGRKLDISTGGEAGIDWANVGSPTTALVLSGTTVGVVSSLTGHTAQTGDAYARLGAPAGASVSADVAAVKSDTASAVTKLGTPAGASVSADVAAVKTVADNTYSRLGAPAGASHAADVAAVKSDTAAVKVKTDFLPSATAGAAGGLFIAGANAATTVNITGNLIGSIQGNVNGDVLGEVNLSQAALDFMDNQNTYEGYTQYQINEMLVGVMTGKTTRSGSSPNITLHYLRQDGTNPVIELTNVDNAGNRSSTGTYVAAP